MRDIELSGQVVYLTLHMEKWLKELNSEFNVPLSNRVAKVIKVFDWDTEEGRTLLSARDKVGKWGSLDPKDFKFVLKVYFPDLIKKDKVGLTIEEVVPRYYPGSKKPMFIPFPLWMIKDINKEEKQVFVLEEKESTDKSTKPKRKRASKKSTTKKKTVKKPSQKNRSSKSANNTDESK